MSRGLEPSKVGRGLHGQCPRHEVHEVGPFSRSEESKKKASTTQYSLRVTVRFQRNIDLGSFHDIIDCGVYHAALLRSLCSTYTTVQHLSVETSTWKIFTANVISLENKGNIPEKKKKSRPGWHRSSASVRLTSPLKHLGNHIIRRIFPSIQLEYTSISLSRYPELEPAHQLHGCGST